MEIVGDEAGIEFACAAIGVTGGDLATLVQVRAVLIGAVHEAQVALLGLGGTQGVAVAATCIGVAAGSTVHELKTACFSLREANT